MSSSDFDVVVVGAGAAGLTAFAELDRAGYRVLCLEARDRIGGRIFTANDPLSRLPIELGAEFIHGRPPEIWQLIRSASMQVYDVVDASVRIKNGSVQNQEDAWEPVDHLMQDLRKAAERGEDQSFADFLARSAHPSEAKELSTSFVEGFNAARKEVIGIASLAEDAEASDQIDGHRSFRFSNGYNSVPQYIFRNIAAGESKLLLNNIVTGVEWSAGSVTLTASSVLTGATTQISSRRVVFTVPLGVLQAGAGVPGFIQWKPQPENILQAAGALAFGHVVRVVCRFDRAFWEESENFADAGFLLSNEKVFPTWWTPLAVRAPLLTGWSAGPHADPLLGKPQTFVIQQAIGSLARILGTPADRIQRSLQQVYFHDWHADPFCRGAYSYVPVGALGARRKLAEPVKGTLYFAGEATELNGHSATVHGAIASGLRVARQITDAAR
jgi:monoamine oxidase